MELKVEHHKVSRDELVALLGEALKAMEDEVERQEEDHIGLSCGNCEAGVPMAHSLGCLIRQALWLEEHGS